MPREPTRFDPLAWWAAHDPSREAIVEVERARSWTYGALDDLADRWCGALARLGVRPDDRIALLARNRVEHFAVLAAAARLGAMFVPLNWRLAAPEQARVLDDATPRVLLVADEFVHDAAQAILCADGTAPAVCHLDRDAPSLLQAMRTFPSEQADATSPAMLLYTSGSTGAPKGVIVSHRQLQWNAIATHAGWELSSADVAAVTSPLFHTAGWGVFALPLLACGGRLVLFETFEPNTLVEGLRARSVTLAFGVPTQFEILRTARTWGAPLPALRFMLTGGAPCPRALYDDVVRIGYPFREGYGLTECGPNCFATLPQQARAHPGTVGRPLPHLEARLVDAFGLPVRPGAVGALELRGPQLFGGYYGAPERTAEAMTGDGWLRTGDLATRASNGLWSIQGRRKEMFITGGENVFPGEVEAALRQCTGVAAAAVVGRPDAHWGEVGAALIVRAPSHPALTAGSVLTEVRRYLAGYKVPKSLLFAPVLPTLGSGKVNRDAVAALFEEPHDALVSGRRGGED